MIFERIKYLLVFTLPIAVYYSFNTTGIGTYSPLFIYFGLVPGIELFFKPRNINFTKKQEKQEKEAKIYDWILFFSVPVQVFFVGYFLYIVQFEVFVTADYWGKVTAMGLMCGVLGINVGHELGHRQNRWEQFLGEILLLSSLDTHFLPYHNAGHHKNVATPNDSATAKRNQWVFSFWITSHFGSYYEAWKVEKERLQRNDKHWLTLKNRMVSYTICNVLLLTIIYYFCDLHGILAFIFAAIFGILLLETVNYIEHYGLLRKQMESGRYEKVKHSHSWNSDHPVGKTLLFNLSRHSDHHYNGSKKYQILKSLDESPKMPTGYPGMMLLSLVPPLWFAIMNSKLNSIQ